MSRVPLKEVTSSLKVQRSVFTGILVPLKSGKDASGILTDLRKKHFSATHICWAYRVYKEGSLVENSSDAGEPSGTAGIPILNALKKKNMINAACFVVRIFGGQKLGRRGLAAAYGTCAFDTANLADCVKWEPETLLRITAPLEYYGSLMNLVVQSEGHVRQDNTAGLVEWVVSLPERVVPVFSGEVNTITRGAGVIRLRRI